MDKLFLSTLFHKAFKNMNTSFEKFHAFLSYLAKNAKYGFNRRLSVKSNISEQYISKILNMKKEGTEDTRRTLAQALNYDYSEFLRLGQAVIDGKDPALAEEEEFKGLTADTLRERGFLSVPFSDNMRLAA